MTDMELKQTYFEAPVSQLLPILQEAEKALKLLYPHARNYAELSEKKRECEEALKTAESGKKGKTASLAIFVGAWLLLSILSNVVNGFMALLCMLGSIFFLVCVGAVVFMHLGDMKTIKDCKASIPELEKQGAAALEQADKIKEQYYDWLYVRQLICPKECVEPKYMRVFVKFFEDRRADSLKEALNLFEEYMHREYLENQSAVQAQASYAAKEAAYVAMQASQQAAFNASAAKASAERTEFYTRFQK